MYGAKGTQAYAKIEVESAVMSASHLMVPSARWYARVCSWKTVISLQKGWHSPKRLISSKMA